MHILLVKVSSMGDLIQALPAITDAQRAIPELKIDWVVENSFTDVPKLHPGINRIITVAYRQWRETLKRGRYPQGAFDFLRELRQQRYDRVVDAQSNTKSALISLLSRGLRIGVEKSCAHEAFIHWAYQQRISAALSLHHVTRMRTLFANALGYTLPDTFPDYGIRVDYLPQIDVDLPERYAFITHTASRAYKLWPQASWETVIDDIYHRYGLHAVLPWHSEQELALCQALAKGRAHVTILPACNLREKARVVAGAALAIGTDTGLSHLAAAMRIPNVVMYGPMPPEKVGTMGAIQRHLVDSVSDCVPCERSRCQFAATAVQYHQCMRNITPMSVNAAVADLLAD